MIPKEMRANIHIPRADTTIPDIWKMMSVEGQILREEAVLLYKLASRVRDGAIVEIGSFRGKSTTALALGSRAGSSVPVFAIEPHEEFVGVLGGRFGAADRSVFFRNMLQAECLDIVRLVNLGAEIVARCWDQPIGLLFIDGDHRYESVKRDFEGFAPWVNQRGLIAFHDSNVDPGRVIREALTTGDYDQVLEVGSITVLLKTSSPNLDSSSCQQI